EITPCYEIEGEEVHWIQESKGYRLPTEAEWEYAARGGEKSQPSEYAGSPDLDQVGWYTANSEGETQAVGQKRPNALGLYDLSGNVWEWCWDWYDNYSQEPQIDPTGPEGGSFRVFRGGSWSHGADGCRVASRSYLHPSSRYHFFGFRLARSL
ncbi:MAG: SUMF1/EgtB/PvdO family nonheme iron enzyme, partial [Bacteroidota bacterium]